MRRYLLPLLLLPVWAQADPLSSCTNIGGGLTSPSYTITGTTYNICSGCVDGETIADVNGLTLNSGDAVLFKAGETFTISSEANRLNMVSGVLYGRYDSGVNPAIQGSAGLTFSVNFRSLIEADSDSDITVDGIDIDNSPSGGIMIRNTATSSVSNLTITNTEGWGIAFINGTDHVADKLVINAADGGPHESITMSGANGVVVSNIRSVGNGHAAINTKDGSQNVEIFGSEFAATNNDPLFYIERASNVHVHDNWIRDATGTYKALFNIAVEPLGGAQYNRDVLVENNVITTNQQFGVRLWIKAGVDTFQEPNFQNITIRNNAIVFTGQSGEGFWSGIDAFDSRGTNNGAWDNIIIRDNVIWETSNADGISLRSVNTSEFTVEYNLFETGESGGSDLGTNAVFTGVSPFTDLVNNDYDPAGPAVGAGSGGGDIGANVTWTCGLGSDPNPDPTLSPISTAKPDPHTIDTLETHYPDHLWVFNDATGGTTIDDEGSAATDCDLTINGANQSGDVLGTYWVFNASESDTMTSSCSDPPTTTGVTCVIMSYPVPPSAVQTAVSWGDADDAFQVAAINVVNGSGAARAGICAGPSSCSGNLNTGPVSITDDGVNMACVRQSGSANDIWINDSGWQVSAWGGSFDWSQIDKFTVGAQGRSSTDQYLTGYVYAVLAYDGSKTDAEMSTIYNSGNPWPQIGIDPQSTPDNEVTSRGDYPAPAN